IAGKMMAPFPKEAPMPLTQNEQADITRANSSGKKPVVFVHGLWLLPQSWNPWRAHFEEQGYTTIAPGWPDDPETVEEARAHPEVFAKKSLKAITAHYLETIGKLTTRPAVVGHSFGGAITQMLAGPGLSGAPGPLGPAPLPGGLPFPFSSPQKAPPGPPPPPKNRRGA